MKIKKNHYFDLKKYFGLPRINYTNLGVDNPMRKLNVNNIMFVLLSIKLITFKYIFL